MKKALVTGGAGFIGSNLVDELIKKEVEVTVIDNESSNNNEKFYWNKKAQNYKYDIREYKKINSLFENIDVVFHLAAESRIQPSIENPLLAAEVNVLGTCNILQASRTHGVKRVVYSSTSSAYGKNEPPHKEEMKTDCLTPYSVSKLSGEEFCKMYYTLFGLETVIFRYFNVYGERQPTRGQYAPVVGLFAKQKRSGRPCTIVGDGLQRRDFTYVGDVAEANILAALSDNQEILGEIFNVGTGKNYNILDLANILEHEYVFIPPRPGESRETLADITKIKNMLQWEPKTNLSNWLALYWQRIG
jgi:UDP-glucose 4-epimerase